MAHPSEVLLFNPRAAKSKPRIPNSVLQVAASIDGQRGWTIVDGNREDDPSPKILDLLASGRFGYLGVTVMPGPQLRQALPIVQEVRRRFPEVVLIWGGYFASNQWKVVIDSPWVDYVINGPGDHAFPQLLEALEGGGDLRGIPNLIYKEGEEHVRTAKAALLNMDELPPLPYDKLDKLYPLEGYLGKTWLGRRTIAYHSSFGCPFTCSFCAVVPVYEARWKGASPQRIFDDLMLLKEKWGGDAVEFHDNNFFTNRKRTVEFAKLMVGQGMNWWGEGRIDTMDAYSDEDLALLRESGCRMIFFGAETGDDEMLKAMDKGGRQTAQQIRDFAERLRRIDIIPEYSFVLGFPGETEEEVMGRIDRDIDFIKEVKRANPDTEIIIYVYSPVPTEGSELFQAVQKAGFSFPQKLEDWVSPEWESFDLRKNPLTPWLTAAMVDKIKNFETVLNAYYPTVSDIRFRGWQRGLMRRLSSVRYHRNWFGKPYELKALQKLWKYRQPETEGF